MSTPGDDEGGPDLIELDDESPEALLALFAARGWGDGLPLVAPTEARVEAMLNFVSTLTTWYEQVRKLPLATLAKLMRLGSRVGRFV